MLGLKRAEMLPPPMLLSQLDMLSSINAYGFAEEAECLCYRFPLLF